MATFLDTRIVWAFVKVAVAYTTHPILKTEIPRKLIVDIVISQLQIISLNSSSNKPRQVLQEAKDWAKNLKGVVTVLNGFGNEDCFDVLDPQGSFLNNLRRPLMEQEAVWSVVHTALNCVYFKEDFSATAHIEFLLDEIQSCLNKLCVIQGIQTHTDAPADLGFELDDDVEDVQSLVRICDLDITLISRIVTCNFKTMLLVLNRLVDLLVGPQAQIIASLEPGWWITLTRALVHSVTDIFRKNKYKDEYSDQIVRVLTCFRERFHGHAAAKFQLLLILESFVEIDLDAVSNDACRKVILDSLLDLLQGCGAERDVSLRYRTGEVWLNFFACKSTRKFGALAPLIYSAVLERLDDVDLETREMFAHVLMKLDPIETLEFGHSSDTKSTLKRQILASSHAGAFRPNHFKIVMRFLGLAEFMQDETNAGSEIPPSDPKDFTWLTKLVLSCHFEKILPQERRDSMVMVLNSIDVMLYFALWESARYCVLTRLKTVLGGPQQVRCFAVLNTL